MKNFITFISQQPRLEKKNYQNIYGVSELEHDFETAFPIMIPLANMAESGEEIRITAINTKDPNGNATNNYPKLIEELDNFSERIGFKYKVTYLEVAFVESVQKEMKFMEELISTFENDDIIIADVSYGNKPSPMILMTALSYADNFCKNTFIKMLVYGTVAFGADGNRTAFISDVTSLFYMNSLVNRMSLIKPEDPLGAIKKMIEL